MTHQTAELGGPLAQCRIAKCLFDHSATEPGLEMAVLCFSS
jgi:hypothetical protein